MRLHSAIALGTLLLFSQGCVTGTAHMLPVAGNPLRAQAEACELACHQKLGPPTSTACVGAMRASDDCSQTSQDRDSYARCLDSCPGARAIDGNSCPDPPLPGGICEMTSRANVGGMIGGTVAVVAVLALVLLLHAVAGSAR
jgi:hypothetical protein